MSSFMPIPEAIRQFKAGGFLIVMDNEDRENEGDLIIAAEHMTPEKMAFMVRYTLGYICAPVLNARADRLGLQPMVSEQDHTDKHKTAYTVTVDYAGPNTTTGILATDRAATCARLAAHDAKSLDFTRPGHVVPLRARDGLLLVRQGHTEAAVALCELAGLSDAAVICEMVRDLDGEMMRLADCEAFGKEHNVGLITIEALKDVYEAQKSGN